MRKTGIGLNQGIQIVNISLKMTVMMQMHGCFINKGHQGVIGIRKRRIDKRIKTIHGRPQQNYID